MLREFLKSYAIINRIDLEVDDELVDQIDVESVVLDIFVNVYLSESAAYADFRKRDKMYANANANAGIGSYSDTGLFVDFNYDSGHEIRIRNSYYTEDQKKYSDINAALLRVRDLLREL